MPLRPPAGFISAFFDPLNNPDAPTIGAATAGDASASVTFTAPTNVGGSAISLFGALSTPENITATAAASPISVTGLTNGTAYTFAVWAINTYGPSAYSEYSSSVTPALPSRALFGGGETTVKVNTINYITITTTGNATDFGDLIVNNYNSAAVSSSTRGIFGAGDVGASTNVMSYVTILTTGNSTDFGDLTITKGYGGCGNQIRGLFFGGAPSSTIQYITIASTGDASNFGNLTVSVESTAGCASPTRGIMCGGSDGAGNNTINYVTINTTGNATDFGDLLYGPNTKPGSCSSSTRGVIAGGVNNTINYITIASTGNALDFGDLTNNVSYGPVGTGSLTRGVFGGGSGWSGGGNTIAYITIASTGNSTDFGDLLYAPQYYPSACSNCHGGL